MTAGLKEYASVARAPFLLLPPTLVAAGAAASAWEGAFSWARTALALVGLVALHMAVNILNLVPDPPRKGSTKASAFPTMGLMSSK